MQNSEKNREKIEIFKNKSKAIEQRFRFFIQNKTGYHLIAKLWYKSEYSIKKIFQFCFDIAIDGIFIYITYSGIINPINVYHRILAFGLIPFEIYNLYNRFLSRFTLHRIQVVKNLPEARFEVRNK